MRLIDLEPRWVVAHRWDDADGTMQFQWAEAPLRRHGMGLSFLCPVHRDHRLAVMFANPLDGQPPDAEAQYLWKRDGDTFESITLGPSVDASGNTSSNGEIQTPCWHGFIRNGMIQ